MTKDTIVNCWKKSGLIESNQSKEELISIENKERTKEKEELEDVLKMIGREAFFKQFIHPSLKTEILSSDDFINLEENTESSLAILTDKEKVSICRNYSEEESHNEIEEETTSVSSKEAYAGFRAFSKFVEQSTFYDDQKLELLEKCEDCIFEIKQEQLKQTKIIDFFKKTTLRN